MGKKEIIKSLILNKKLLKKYNVQSIALFGSYVRNEQNKKSDIDFLVKFIKPTFDDYIGLLAFLRKLVHRKIDLVNINALNKRIKPFILKEAEWI